MIRFATEAHPEEGNRDEGGEFETRTTEGGEIGEDRGIQCQKAIKLSFEEQPSQ